MVLFPPSPLSSQIPLFFASQPLQRSGSARECRLAENYEQTEIPVSATRNANTACKTATEMDQATPTMQRSAGVRTGAWTPSRRTRSCRLPPSIQAAKEKKAAAFDLDSRTPVAFGGIAHGRLEDDQPP
jgi:hypothetical protein